MNRRCARPGCGEPAAATLSYRYASSTVWLDDVAAEADPSTYDLCRRHAAGLTVPHGWNLTDGRSTARSPYRAERAS